MNTLAQSFLTPSYLFEKVTHGPWITVGCNLQYRLDFHEGSQALIISFQSTKTMDDWAFDALALPTLFRKRHLGLYLQYWSARGKLLKYILPALERFRPSRIELVGYSAGATHVTNFAWDLAKKTSLPIALTLFGAPRYYKTRKRVCEEFFGQARDIYVSFDPVHSLPLLWKQIGYPIKLPSQGEMFATLNHTPYAYREGLRKNAF